ncbi:rRNA methyltransferase 3B, mitochondrial [Salminus brasiliensis]|uniref:rRNA methyltransferase 3B, mitochondrial n=1 Tax=Salminus brasiliensis TaxID=930266 RepID=UPI003B82E4B5
MATLMRYAGGMCTILEPTWTVRISRYVRRRPQCSDVRDVQVEGANAAPVTEAERSVGQKHGGEVGAPPLQGSDPSPRETASKEATFTSRLSELSPVSDLRYENAEPGDKSLSRLVSLARSKKLREQQGKILLEGRRLITDALHAGVSPQTVFFSTGKRLKTLPLDKLAQASLIKVNLEDVRIWPDLDTTQDLIAVFKRPEVSQMQFPQEKYGKALPLTLICDNMRDPGNLGTSFRCAAAAGCHSILLTKGCVDIWEPKVVRAAMGAHFRLPIISSLTWTDIHKHLPAATTVHVADNCRDSTREAEFPAKPQPQKKAGDYGWVSGHHISKKMSYEDGEAYDAGFSDGGDYEEDRCMQTKLDLQTLPYHKSWAGNHTAIVIGGETHGLSQEALQLADETGGRRLLIPMVQGVDSLNSAMAASVLLFEGRRQLMTG